VKGSLAPTFKTVPPPLEERSGKKNFSTTPLGVTSRLRGRVDLLTPLDATYL
jgi:hypothetical protein